jgi:hypothetical protein
MGTIALLIGVAFLFWVIGYAAAYCRHPVTRDRIDGPLYRDDE